MAKKKNYKKKAKNKKKVAEVEKKEKVEEGPQEISSLKFTFDDIILVLVIIWAVCMVYFRQ